ncbi:MAG: transglutaminase family protein, partial [Vicinamibacteria bacterium]
SAAAATTMKLKIEHHTRFTYDGPVSEAYAEMRLKPLDADGQRCLSFRLSTKPHGEVGRFKDRFGNDVRVFDVLNSHESLVVSAYSEVLTPNVFTPEPPQLSPLEEHDYKAPTPYTGETSRVEALARSVEASDPEQTAIGLMEAVQKAIVYEKGATDVTTNADAALELGRGVCQDFSHVFIAACRRRGLLARYVSGYLFDDGRTAASHAWADVLIPGMGWISLDPTHASHQTSHYVRVAVGRDYADVPPTRGVYKGNAKESMDVVVTVVSIG